MREISSWKCFAYGSKSSTIDLKLLMLERLEVFRVPTLFEKCRRGQWSVSTKCGDERASENLFPVCSCNLCRRKQTKGSATPTVLTLPVLQQVLSSLHDILVEFSVIVLFASTNLRSSSHNSQ